MCKGVSNWAPYWQFHFGEEGQVLNWAPYWQFHFGEGEGVRQKSLRFMDSDWLSMLL